MDATPEPAPPSLPIGRSGRLEAMALSAGDDAAVLVRERGGDGRARALLTTDKLPAGERLVVMPLDEDTEVRVDGDALAVWLGSGSLMANPPRTAAASPTDVPIWASLAGGFLLLLVVALAVIGSAVAFAWIVRLFT
jgi:hypothetical protein